MMELTLTEYCEIANKPKGTITKLLEANKVSSVGVKQVTRNVKAKTYRLEDLQELKPRAMGRPKGVKDSSPRYRAMW